MAAGTGTKGFKFTEQPQPVMSRGKFNQLAKKYGLPATPFWQITKGESGHKPFVQQHDPGDGMVGYGLFQLTPNAWGGGAAKQKFDKLGGVAGMRNIENQFRMARFLYKSAGKSFKPWYGTRFLTDRSGEGTLGPVRPNMQIRGGGGGGGGGGGRVTGATAARTRRSTNVGLNLNTGVSPLMAPLESGLPPRPISNPTAPGFAAKVRMPGGQEMVSTAASTGAQIQPGAGSSLSDLLGQATSGQTVNPLIQSLAQTTPGRAGTRVRGGGRGGGGGGGGGRPGRAPQPHGGYQGTEGAIKQLSKLAKGLTVTSSKRDNTNPYSGSRSDHDNGNKDAYAYDMSNGSSPTPQMDAYAKKVAKALGMSYKKGTPINKTATKNGIRYQLIYRGTGAAFGGNHMNHVHLGAKRVGGGGTTRGVLR